MDDATKPIDEKRLREVLLRALRDAGLAPKDGWVTVRLVSGDTGTQYAIVVVAHIDARAVLTQILRPRRGQAETSTVGVWVLDQTEAQELCRL
jgi:hypothetical protein